MQWWQDAGDMTEKKIPRAVLLNFPGYPRGGYGRGRRRGRREARLRGYDMGHDGRGAVRGAGEFARLSLFFYFKYHEPAGNLRSAIFHAIFAVASYICYDPRFIDLMSS